MSRSLFSQSWHSVADLKPRLVAGARIHRHVYRAQVWYVVQEQAGGRYSRLTPEAHDIVRRMDGRNTVQALWDDACRQADGNIPTQNEIVDLLIQLNAADLLHADVTPDAAALFERYRKRRDQTWKQWLMNPMSLKIPLIDPDPLLVWLNTRFSGLFGPRGALLWLAVVVPAMLLAAQHWSTLTENLGDRVLSSGNLLLMAAVFPFVKALHELGHGLAAKTWGGDVHEMGVMLLVFAPVPYVEASSASAFASRRRRAVVGAAGMLVEMFLAAIAMYVWVLVEPGLLHALAFNVMLIAGISTLLVNGNPLLRYDGYFILCDLIEMPNLGQRGQKYLTLLWDKYVFGVRDLEPSPETPSEKRWLLPYTVLSWCYRVYITLVIILFIAGEFFIFGVLLALWAAASLAVVPLWKAARHVLYAPQLQRRRQHAINSTVALVAGVLLFAAVVPLPLLTQAQGVIWLPEQALLRAGGDGIFVRWLAEPGSRVTRGTPVLLLEDPLLAAELAVARAKVEEAAAHYRSEQFTHPESAEGARQKLDQERRVLARTEERAASLVVDSQVDGVLVAQRPADMPGQYFRKGELLGYVLDGHDFIARVVVRQDDIDLVRTRFQAVQVRLADDVRRVHQATVLREMPGGVEELPTAALGPNGGGFIPVDPSDQSGTKALERIFIFDLRLDPAARPVAFGERVYVRFDHGGEPLLAQGYRRLRQLFLSRFSV